MTTIVPTNFLAVVPKYKLERGPTFLLACDATGLDWLTCRFTELPTSQANSSFVVGDGCPIASDGKCQLTITLAEKGGVQRVSTHRDMRFIWRISLEDSAQAAENLSVLRDSNSPCHQYFGGDGPYQTIVVTKDEEPVDLIRAMRDCKPWAGENT